MNNFFLICIIYLTFVKVRTYLNLSIFDRQDFLKSKISTFNRFINLYYPSKFHFNTRNIFVFLGRGHYRPWPGTLESVPDRVKAWIYSIVLILLHQNHRNTIGSLFNCNLSSKYLSRSFNPVTLRDIFTCS